MKRNLILIAFFIAIIPSIYGQDLNSPQTAEDYFRPSHKNFGFNISMNLASRSEMLEALYLSEGLVGPGIFGGLGMSFRYNISNKVVFRTNATFFNSKQQSNVQFVAPEIIGLSEFMWNNGLMLIIKGTNKLEPYGFLDIGIGRTNSRENVGNSGRTQDMERKLLFRTTRFTTGLGFNYYFAQNIGIGAELGTGVNIVTFPQEFRSNAQTIQFFSGLGGKLGVTIIF